jgi:hypothetical protein
MTAEAYSVDGRMPSEATNRATRQEWRELGFFYDCNDDNKEWVIRGSRGGLLRFAHLLLDYSKKHSSKKLSEHDHFGPYSYLKIGTWNAPEINDDWIAGTLDDLNRLSGLIEGRVLRAEVSDMLRFRQDYAPASSHELTLDVREDEFDPATADAACW